MKNYLITFGSISTALGLWLAFHGQGLGSLALCVSAASTFIAASIIKPISNLDSHEAKFCMAIGSIDKEGLTIEEIKKTMMNPLSSNIISEEALNSIIMYFEIEGIIEYREGKIYRKR